MKHTTVLLSVLALVGIAPAVDSLNVRMIGYCRTSNMAFGVDVDGDYACVTDINGSLRLISVADPAHPSEVGHYDTTFGPYSVAIVNRSYVYMPDSVSGVHVISIADPTRPVEVGFLSTPSGIGGIAVAGQYAYMAAGGELLVVSVADPANPVIVAICDTSGTAVSNVAASGDYAYAIDYNQGLEVISVSDPLHPVEVGHCDLTGAWSVAVSGSYVCVAGQGGLSVISVADPANPMIVGAYVLPSISDVALDGDVAYAAAGGTFGFRVVSIEDPAHPLEVGYYSGVGQANSVTIVNGYIFVADGSTGLVILQYYGSAVEEMPNADLRAPNVKPTISRCMSGRAVLFDAMGRKVANPRSGVYFLQEGLGARGQGSGRMRKVVLQR